MDLKESKTHVKSSTDEFQSSTRQHFLPQFSSHNHLSKHRSESDKNERHQRSLYENRVLIDDEFKKQRRGQVDFQSKIAELEGELMNERRKSRKFRKIISSKIQKQKELEIAYRGIAIKLKKEWLEHPQCFCKNKTGVSKSHSCSSNEKEHMMEDVFNLRKQNSSLKTQLEEMRLKYEHLVKQVTNGQNQDEVNIQTQHLKALNQLYSNQIQKLRQENYKLLAQLKEHQSLFLQNYHNKIDVQQPEQFKLVNENRQKIQKFLQNSGDIKDKKVQKNKRSKSSGDEIFEIQQKEMKETKSLNLNKNQNFPKDHQQPQAYNKNDPQNDSSFRTVQQFLPHLSEKGYRNSDRCIQQSDESFVSIKPFPDFQQVSSVGAGRVSQTSDMNQSKVQLKEILKERTDTKYKNICLKSAIEKEEEKGLDEEQLAKLIIPQQEDNLKYLQYFHSFFMTLNKKLGCFAQKHHIAVELSQICSKIDRIECRHENDLIWLQKIGAKQAEEIVLLIQKIEKQAQKQKQKKINDLNLQLYEIQSQLQQARLQKLPLQKKIDSILQFNKRLQYQMSQMANLSYQSSILGSQRNTFLHEIYRNKISMTNPFMKDASIQCSIISFDEYRRNEHFVRKIASLINQVIEARVGPINTSFYLIVGDNMQEEFKKILDNFITLVQKSYSQTLHQQFSKKRSTSYQQMKIEAPKKSEPDQKGSKIHVDSIVQPQNQTQLLDQIDLDLYYTYEAENEQLQKTIKENDQIIFRLQVKIGLQKLEIERLDSALKTASTKSGSSALQTKKQQMEEVGSGLKLRESSSKSLMKEESLDEKQQFIESNELRQYNNISFEKDEDVKDLKLKMKSLQQEIQNCKEKLRNKKRRIRYLNH